MTPDSSTPPSADSDAALNGAVPRISISVAATVLVLVGYMLAAPFAQILNIGFGLWFTEIVVFFGIVSAVVRYGRRDVVRYTGLSRPNLRNVLYGFVVGAVNNFAVVIPLQALSTSIAPQSLLRHFDQSKIFEAQSGVDLFLILSGVCVAAPICEEFFFRGVLQRGLFQPTGGDAPERFLGLKASTAIILTGFVFSAFHLDPVGLLARWELGILFGYFWWKSRSVWPGIGAHFANNFTSSLLYFAFKNSGGGDEDVGLKGVLSLAAVCVPILVGLLLMPRRFKSLLTVPTPATEGALPDSPSLARLGAPWVVGAMVAIGAVFALDYRGIQLNVVDYFRIPVDTMPRDAPEPLKLEHDSLLAIRKKVRKGELPMSLYESKRKAFAGNLDKWNRRPKDEKSPKPTATTASDGFRPGEHEVRVHLKLPEGANELSPEAEKLRALAGPITKKLESNHAGEVDGVEVEGPDVVISIYGPSADAIATDVREAIGKDAPKETRLELRRGPGGTEPSVESL